MMSISWSPSMMMSRILFQLHCIDSVLVLFWTPLLRWKWTRLFQLQLQQGRKGQYFLQCQDWFAILQWSITWISSLGASLWFFIHSSFTCWCRFPSSTRRQLLFGDGSHQLKETDLQSAYANLLLLDLLLPGPSAEVLLHPSKMRIKVKIESDCRLEHTTQYGGRAWMKVASLKWCFLSNWGMMADLIPPCLFFLFFTCRWSRQQWWMPITIVLCLHLSFESHYWLM